ncbi:M90 family metallopeptidase [Rhodohalobacter halophilus]|uniref:M90 family metallopeptidase n=1 Tax=Rhodohalobacter halophilus TaxID=1812810 RepID=UPI00083FA713|nr:M90 family metallopeptidase [Rhodohalobacter halophilus]
MPVIRYFIRKWVKSQPLSAERQRILQQKVPLFRKLPGHYKERLQEHLKILLHEKYFEGCGGLQLTEDMKVIVGAYASVLILEETADYYGDLQSILIYPDDYVAPVNQETEGGFIEEGFENRKGEYWQAGVIVLSWQDIESQLFGEERGSGLNLIIHEFSHFLDDRYGLTAGIDLDGKTLRDDEWTNIIAKAYRDLRFTRKSSFLDRYGAENPAEFFSVATELFFERPERLLQENKKLYTLLEKFYRLDPIRWK